MTRVGLVRVTGYAGSELARWVLAHPRLELAAACSRAAAGRRLADVVPALAGFAELVVQAPEPATLTGLDAVFLATPHGAARGLADQLGAAPVLVDLSADHRADPAWVYGQPEWCAAALAGASRIAAPGCFATAIALAVAPLVAAGAVAGPVDAVALTGSTGSGVTPSAGTHHPERFANARAYKVLRHQHVPEIRALWARLGEAPELRFVPVSAPVDRGILATCIVPVAPGTDAVDCVRRAVAPHPLLRMRDGSPELRHVRGTAFADLSAHQDGDVAVVLCAIDNLGRGAAAQAIAAFNLSRGWPVHTGLHTPALTP